MLEIINCTKAYDTLVKLSIKKLKKNLPGLFSSIIYFYSIINININLHRWNILITAHSIGIQVVTTLPKKKF